MPKPLNISESAAVQMPMKTVASLILLVAANANKETIRAKAKKRQTTRTN